MPEGFDAPKLEQDELIRRYLSQLPDKLALIESLWERVRISPADGDSLSLLRLHAHRLAGSAAPHGLPALGESARLLDRALAALTENRAAPAAERVAALVPLLDELRRALRESR